MAHVCDGMKLYDALTLPDYRDSFAKNKTAFNVANNTDKGYFEWLMISMTQNARERFAFGMKGIGSLYAKTLPTSYPWQSLGRNATIVDVGGGTGHMLMPVIREFPELNLVVQDLQYAIPMAEKAP